MKEVSIKYKAFMWYLAILANTDSDTAKFTPRPTLYYWTFLFENTETLKVHCWIKLSTVNISGSLFILKLSIPHYLLKCPWSSE